jgi:hypothetical protein
MSAEQADKYWNLLTTWGKRVMQLASVLGTVFVGMYFIRVG